MANLIGTSPNQAPANADLGPLAYVRPGSMPLGLFEADALADTQALPIDPSLSVNFAQTGVMDPRVVFSRTSSATRFNHRGVLETVAANVGRIEHDPLTHQCLGLLGESQSTNLFTYSEQLENVVWQKFNLSVTDNFIDTIPVVAPDGTLTADLLVENNVNIAHNVGQVWAFSAGTTYTLSAFLKKKSRASAQIIFAGDAFPPDAYANFDLENGVFAVGGPGTSAAMQKLPNDWYRCSVTAVANNTISSPAFIWMTNTFIADRAQSYQGDGTSAIYVWGAQLEEMPLATSYIKTIASQVTRTRDIASVPLNDNYNLGVYNRAEGTLVGQVYARGFGENFIQIPKVNGVNGAGGVSVRGLVRLLYGKDSASHYSAIQAFPTNGGPDSVPSVQCEPGSISGVSYSSQRVLGAVNGQTILNRSDDFASEDKYVLLVRLFSNQDYNAAASYNCVIAFFQYYPVAANERQLKSLTAW